MTQACTQPGCAGTIEDGFCDVCGLAPAPLAAAAAGTAGPGPAAWGPSTGIRWADSGVVPWSGPSGSAGSGAGSAGSGSAGSGSGSGRGSRGSRSGSGRSARGRLGAGLVTVPPVPALDPAAAVLADPRVPENRRICGGCSRRVGQSRDGRPGMTEGFCPHCGTRFSFTPKLVPGELVAGQYEVLGCLAHGGLGWIYLARDRNVSDRWVVLKGLLNTGDADAMEAAVAERHFLAQIEHPNIVRIYNFVRHASQGDGETAGYIVMEYVGGKSLKQIRLDARARGGAVPLAHALAYALEILPALGYLHDQGLVYCDFKPDNVIQTEEQLKLIDMGGVRAVAGDGAIYGTKGYQAPEIEARTAGPSPASDLYTVGRALAVLTFDFHGYQGEYEYRLPEAEPLLQRHESFARLLRRATHPDPELRFQSAGDMAEQLTGVLREVLAAGDGRPRPAFSGLFSPELRAAGTDLAPEAARTGPPPAAEVIAGLPAPLVDGTDPAAGYLATLAGLPPAHQAATLRAAVRGEGGIPAPVARSAETRLALARALVTGGDQDAAAAVLADHAAAEPGDWRTAWYTGLCGLAAGRPADARAAFGAVYDELPGELATKLALGFAAEAGGDQATARHYYRLVATTDRSYVSAAFGLARTSLAGGDRAAAVDAVKAVPSGSTHYAAARIAALRLRVAGGAGTGAADLADADAIVAELVSENRLDEQRKQLLTVEVLTAALSWAASARPGGRAAAPATILGCAPDERALRLGLESGYRALARLSPDPARKRELVDMANSVRPRTWL